VAGADPVDLSLENFQIEARADGFLLTLIDHRAPLVPRGEVISASPVTAESLLDSLPESRGFASLPYPGDFLVSLPGTAAGLAGKQFPALPSYPLYASSSYPVAPKVHYELAGGAYGISSSSQPTESSAQATAGLAAPQAANIASTARTTQNPDGSVVADAETHITGLGLGPLLRIGDITSRAHMTVVPGLPPEMTSSLAIKAITVGGINLGLTDKGLTLGPSVVAVPGLLESLLTALSINGAKVSYLPGSRTSNGVTSASLGIDYEVTVPGQGVVDTNLIFGRVSTTAEAVSPPAAVSGGGSAGMGGGGSGSAPATGFAVGTNPVPALSGSAPSVAAPSSSPALAQRKGTRSALRGRLRTVDLPLPSGRSFYLILILAGVAIVGGGQLIHRLALKT
jgi:hypothetical protein